MSMLDGLMNQFGGQIGAQVANVVATKLGIDPAMAQMAIAALTRAHPQPGDTVATAAQQSGLSTDMLGQIVSQIGGEGALGQLAGALGGTTPAQPGAPEAGLGGMLGDLVGDFMGSKK